MNPKYIAHYIAVHPLSQTNAISEVGNVFYVSILSWGTSSVLSSQSDHSSQVSFT